MKLYEIDDLISACFDPETGEVDEERLTDLMMERDKKVEKVALWIQELKGDAEQIGNEINRLKDRKDAVENKIEKLKKWLAFALNGEKFKTALVSISFRETERVVVDNPMELDETLLVIKKEPNRTAIKKALSEWDFVKGAHLEKNVAVTIR